MQDQKNLRARRIGSSDRPQSTPLNVRSDGLGVYSSKNGSFLDLLAKPGTLQHSSFQSPQEASCIGFPRWLDEQLEAALDRRSSRRSGFSTPLTPTHEPLFKVPVYSPGKKSPDRLDLPEYLVMRQEALDTIKSKVQCHGVENQTGPSRAQATEHDISASEAQFESFNPEDFLLSPDPKNRKQRVTQDFSRYFSDMLRSLSLDDHNFPDLSPIEKQVVMFRYGNTKVIKSRQDATIETLVPHDALNLDEFAKTLNDHRFDSNQVSEVTHEEIEQAWQKYAVAPTPSVMQYQIGDSIKRSTTKSKDLSLLEESLHPPIESKLELNSLQRESDEVFVSRTSSPSLSRTPSDLDFWLYPKPSLSSLRIPGQQSVQQGSDVDRDRLVPRLVSQDGLAVRRPSSFSATARISANSKSIPNRLAQSDHVLQDAEKPRTEDAQASALSTNSRSPHSVVSGRPCPSQPCLLSPDLPEAPVALAFRAVRRLTTLKPKRRASSADIHGLASTHAKLNHYAPEASVNSFFDEKKTLINSRSSVKGARIDAKKKCERKSTIPTASDVSSKSFPLQEASISLPMIEEEGTKVRSLPSSSDRSRRGA